MHLKIDSIFFDLIESENNFYLNAVINKNYIFSY